MHIRYFPFAFSISATFASSIPGRDTSCNGDYALCSPAGATSFDTPQLGSPEFLSLFADIVSSSLPSSSVSRRQILDTRAQSSLCCNAQLSCLVASNLAIPFCYDRFTTNYYLPDASFGTVVGGAYTSSSGDTANLETGDFKFANGTTGNIYASNEALKPNTATLPMPSQFTGSGVGSAIAASTLGLKVTLTITSIQPGTTVPGTTLSASNVPAHTATETILVPTTITTSTSDALVVSTAAVTSISQVLVAGSEIPASTVQGTTVLAQTVVVTTTSNLAASDVASVSGSGTSSASSGSSSVAATTSKSGGQARWRVGRTGSLAVVLMGLVGYLL